MGPDGELCLRLASRASSIIWVVCGSQGYAFRDSHNLNFFAMLELYNPVTCIFFTPSGELGFALHEMYEVSGLLMGDRPYEEYTPGTEDLYILKK